MAKLVEIHHILQERLTIKLLELGPMQSQKKKNENQIENTESLSEVGQEIKIYIWHTYTEKTDLLYIPKQITTIYSYYLLFHG